MRIKPFVVSVVLSVSAASAAMAACPSVVTGTTAEALRANEQRLLCLQRELAEQTLRRNNQLDLDLMTRALQDMQLQRRFDLLPPVQPPFVQ